MDFKWSAVRSVSMHGQDEYKHLEKLLTRREVGEVSESVQVNTLTTSHTFGPLNQRKRDCDFGQLKVKRHVCLVLPTNDEKLASTTVCCRPGDRSGVTKGMFRSHCDPVSFKS